MAIPFAADLHATTAAGFAHGRLRRKACLHAVGMVIADSTSGVAYQTSRFAAGCRYCCLGAGHNGLHCHACSDSGPVVLVMDVVLGLLVDAKW